MDILTVHIDEDEANADWIRNLPGVRERERRALADAMAELQARRIASESAVVIERAYPADGEAIPLDHAAAVKAWETRKRKKAEQAGEHPVGGQANQVREVSEEDVQKFLTGGLPKSHGSLEATVDDYENRGFCKKTITAAIGKAGGDSLNQDDAASIVKEWAHTSADEDAKALMLQKAAHEMYGEGDFPGDLAQKLKSASGTDYGPHQETYHVWGYNKNKSLSDVEIIEKQKRFLEITQQKTQEYFKKLGYGPDDEITLYRGVREIPRLAKVDIGGSVETESWPLSSWSTSKKIAEGFGLQGNYGVVLRRKTKIREIVTTCRTGLGCLREQEFVVRASKGQTATRVMEALDVIRVHLDEDEANADWIRNLPGAKEDDLAALDWAMAELEAEPKATWSVENIVRAVVRTITERAQG